MKNPKKSTIVTHAYLSASYISELEEMKRRYTLSRKRLLGKNGAKAAREAGAIALAEEEERVAMEYQQFIDQIAAIECRVLRRLSKFMNAEFDRAFQQQEEERKRLGRLAE